MRLHNLDSFNHAEDVYGSVPKTTCSRVKTRKADLKAEVFAHYGGKCVCCGETHPKFLTIDHINGGGRAQRAQHGNGIDFYRWIKKFHFPADLQILCWNCNCGRAHNGGICPHKEVA